MGSETVIWQEVSVVERSFLAGKALTACRMVVSPSFFLFGRETSAAASRQPTKMAREVSSPCRVFAQEFPGGWTPDPVAGLPPWSWTPASR